MGWLTTIFRFEAASTGREKPFVRVHIVVVSRVFHGVPGTTVSYYRDHETSTVNPRRRFEPYSVMRIEIMTPALNPQKSTAIV